MPAHKEPREQRILLHRIQNILVIISASLIVSVILLEMVSSHVGLLCFIAYFLGAISYGAEMVIIVLRAREHEVHKEEMVMPAIFGTVYISLAFKYLLT